VPPGETHPPVNRRLAAIASMVILVVTVGVAIARTVGRIGAFVIVIVLAVVFVLSVWVALTRVRSERIAALAVAVAAVAVVLAVVVAGNLLVLVASLVALVVAVVLGRFALARDASSLKRSETRGVPVGSASQGVLVMNLRSGGGKAERFRLVDECRRRGIEPVVLQEGDDLVDLARQAIERGADVIGMAGGDGSQALVAAVAADHGVAFVVVPAGTRNHLALDLGLDRDDVVGALDAFGEAVERRMDLGEVNGRTFVNNVSLGLYASIVQSPEYRDAKLSTVLGALPEMLGPDATPMDLRYDGPDGRHHDGAHMIQVSNGPYGSMLRTMGSRSSVDAGVLGVIALTLSGEAAATRFLAALGGGHPERYDGFESWTTTTFEVTSGGPIEAGIDGEALTLESPLRFTTRPGVLRVRLSPDAIGYSPAARALAVRDLLPGLWRVARGKAVAIDA
jgi:diacylglycerol kinase family enzyme